MHPLSLACHPQKAYLCVCSASTALSLAIVRSLATHKDKPHVSAISHMPSIIPYATFLHLTNKGIPYASALSRMPSGVSRQLKAYPMRPFCIRSLSHAVRCLATAEGIPYVAALSHMPSGVLASDKGIPYEPIRPPLAPLIDFERGVPAPPRQCRAGSLRAAGQCSQKTETEINRQQRHSISVTTMPLNIS